MKNYISILTLLIVLSSCKNDDDISVAENPIATAIVEANLVVNETLGDQTLPVIKLGYTFSSSKNGAITHLGYLINNPGNTRVEIWDKEAASVIYTELINSSSSGIANQPIPPVSIIAEKEYIITCTQRFYENYYNSNFTTIYPITVGSITLIESRAVTDLFAFPSIANPNAAVLTGIPTFTFQPN